jgi:hypothetical protein
MLHGCTRLLLAYESRRRALSFWDRALEVWKWRWIRWGEKRWHTKFEDSSSLFPVEKEPRRKNCSLAARVECDSNTWHGQEDFFGSISCWIRGFMIWMMILCNVFHCHSGHSNPCTCCSNLSLAACRCEALPVGMLQRDQTITTDVTGLTSCTNCTFDPARLKVYKKMPQPSSRASRNRSTLWVWVPVTSCDYHVYQCIPTYTVTYTSSRSGHRFFGNHPTQMAINVCKYCTLQQICQFLGDRGKKRKNDIQSWKGSRLVQRICFDPCSWPRIGRPNVQMG